MQPVAPEPHAVLWPFCNSSMQKTKGSLTVIHKEEKYRKRVCAMIFFLNPILHIKTAFLLKQKTA